MELVPIIYNSLFILVSFLSVIVFSSLICSRFSLCGKSDDKRKKDVAKVSSFENNLTQREKEHKVSRSIIRENSVKDKVRFVSKSDIRETAVKHKSERNFQRVSRYSVVNADYDKQNLNKGLYEKFSKLSVKYSQSV